MAGGFSININNIETFKKLLIKKFNSLSIKNESFKNLYFCNCKSFNYLSKQESSKNKTLQSSNFACLTFFFNHFLGLQYPVLLPIGVP